MIKIEEIVELPEDTYMDTLIVKSGIKVVVECYDGSVETTYGLLMFSWAYFNFNRIYNVPVSVMQIPELDSIPNNKLHFKLANTGLKLTYDYLEGKVPLNEISESGYDILCNQINKAILYLEEYSMTLDAEDYLELEDYPEMVEVKAEMHKGIKLNRTSGGKFNAIQTAYSKFKDILTNGLRTPLKDNGIVHLNLSGTSKLTQLNQGIVSRGFASDVNSDFFAEPIPESFSEGLNDPYAYALETCSGAKASMYQKDPMSDTEYLHRLVQMISASFQNLHLGDCGSTVTYPATITKEYTPYIIGKYYLEAGQVIEVTRANVDSLVGKTVNFRMPSGCKVEDNNGACSICCGASSLSLSKGANLGHTASTKFMGTGSQKVLSVKHEDLASLSIAMRIGSQFINYLEVAPNNREVMLKRRDLTLAIPVDSAQHIRYIYTVDDVNELNINELSSITTIDLTENTEDGYGEVYSGGVGDAGEVVNLSPKFLEYLKQDHKRLVIQPYKRKRYYFIDLSDFPVEDSIFLTPFKHFDMLIQHRLTKRFLYSPKGDPKPGEELGPRLTDYNTFGEAALALLDLTKDKLGINLAVLEMAIYSYTVRDPNNYDFRPVKGSNICEFMSMEPLYNHRSLAAKLVSEKQVDVLKSPLLITNRKRSSHPMDEFHVDEL